MAVTLPIASTVVTLSLRLLIARHHFAFEKIARPPGVPGSGGFGL
jgi:hypothetical protein